MSKLEIFNRVFQWSFFRVCRVVDTKKGQTHWGLLGPVLPLTGWNARYVGWSRAFVRWKVLKNKRLP